MDKLSYHHGDLKAELVQKGLKILDSDGFEGFSLRKAAKACGVSQTAPYRHFKNKDELIAEIMKQALGAFNESLAAAVYKYPESPINQIREMGVAYVRFFLENPHYLRLLFLSDIHLVSDEPFCSEGGQLSDGHPFAIFFSAVQRYKDATPDEHRDVGDLMIYCWGLVHGIAVLAVRQDIPPQYDVTAMIDRIIWSERFL